MRAASRGVSPAFDGVDGGSWWNGVGGGGGNQSSGRVLELRGNQSISGAERTLEDRGGGRNQSSGGVERGVEVGGCISATEMGRQSPTCPWTSM